LNRQSQGNWGIILPNAKGSEQGRCSSAPTDYDAFEHLRRSLFLPDSALMAMFTIYCDASGGDPQQTVFTVGGVIAKIAQWDMFNKVWPKILATGPRPEYHATDVEDSERLWGWTKKHKQQFQTAAYSTVKLRAHIGISSSVIKKDFESAHSMAQNSLWKNSKLFLLLCQRRGRPSFRLGYREQSSRPY
jgi:hypothetical protein